MRVKAAYYLKSLPTKIAVVLEDGSAKMTNLTPFRTIAAAELERVAAFDQPAYRREMLKDEIPAYVYKFYGLEKVD